MYYILLFIVIYLFKNISLNNIKFNKIENNTLIDEYFYINFNKENNDKITILQINYMLHNNIV